nr:immunoglobulin heavy chain junction region [Mus musculus]
CARLVRSYSNYGYFDVW